MNRDLTFSLVGGVATYRIEPGVIAGVAVLCVNRIGFPTAAAGS